MEREASAERLFLARGFDEISARSRAALLADVERGFERAAGAAPAWRWFVPGRIEIFGKHTDYVGGRSLLAATPRGFAVVAGPRSDGLVRVVDVRYGDDVTVDPAAGEPPRRRWPAYVS